MSTYVSNRFALVGAALLHFLVRAPIGAAVYTKAWPSGDQDSALCEVPVPGNCCGARLLSAGISHILQAAMRPDRYTRRLPSGDHTGQWLSPSVVIFESTARAKSYT